ncbi:xanthine dehydrogenase family protein molybdopterin-binding subunit [Lichenibacterium dinghuense]|uniref:xanthine dehydrogenase family protein molybdopterin-binding subunit n=1 Tax=Lichenibacterium dinghuense TaxID=2895977 RepID=UPI001F168A19|nr:molybdopterin cofactor-binding domain-containing protein [Lichenibacterium sp. 6Y81]
MIPNALPQGLVDNPRPDQWVAFTPDRRVTLKSGKVELGQGILTALRQIAAEELDVEPTQVGLVSGDTALSPDEGYTAGSLSVEVSGAAVRLVCAEIRGRLVDAAAERLGAEPGRLRIAAGEVAADGEATGLGYWSLALDLASPVPGTRAPKRVEEHRVVGRSLQRLDLPEKVFGSPFVHDMRLPGLVHAAVLHRPWPGARLASPDALIARVAGAGVAVVRDGDFVAFVSDGETAAAEALARAWEKLAWDGGTPLRPEHGEAGRLTERPTRDRRLGAPSIADPRAAFRLKARYSRPFIAHGAIGPSCAVALFERGRLDDGRLDVWTHSQGVVPLRDAIARVVGLAPDRVVIHHRQGAGCYGHNGADDAALDAALVAMRRAGVPVRVLWRREDEMSSSPFGAAGVVEIEAGCDPDGRPLDWSLDLWSPIHGSRPGMNGGVNLLSATALAEPWPGPEPCDVPDERGGGAVRNAFALYDLPPQDITHHLVWDHPARTSSMRGLGALANAFAIESFIDEIAVRCGRDPLAYRLSLLSDGRARHVLERAAALSGWALNAQGGTGSGRGIAFSRYKNRAAYAAVVAEVDVDDEVRVRRVWAAVDAGLVVNPDGAANQVEGGIIQAASWALKEQVLFDEGRVATATWDRYPILRFSEVPEVHVDFVGAAEHPSLGIGEVALGPTAAAIGNAIAHALGVRVRDLPLTRDRVIAAMS